MASVYTTNFAVQAKVAEVWRGSMKSSLELFYLLYGFNQPQFTIPERLLKKWLILFIQLR